MAISCHKCDDTVRCQRGVRTPHPPPPTRYHPTHQLEPTRPVSLVGRPHSHLEPVESAVQMVLASRILMKFACAFRTSHPPPIRYHSTHLLEPIHPVPPVGSTHYYLEPVGLVTQVQLASRISAAIGCAFRPVGLGLGGV